MLNIQIIIQARLSSTRMPKKVLKPFFGTESILDIQIKELKHYSNFPLIIATTDQPADDRIEDFAQQYHVELFRGNEEDVLSRFIESSNADFIVRICSDNPFMQLGSINEFLKAMNSETDYISYADAEVTPAIRTHWGLYPEIVSRKALVKAHEETEKLENGAFYREHVTNYIYGNPEKFNVKLLPAPEIIRDRKDLRFTIDTPEDFENMQKLYEIIQENGRDFSLENLVRTADEHEEIKAVMGEGIAKFSK
ncbi:MAG: cytidylyltransferase domain-containing protein [Bacteroidota bacterium]